MKKTAVVVYAIGLAVLPCCAPGAERPEGVTLENNPFVKLPRAHAMPMGDDVMISTVVDPTTDASVGFEGLNADHRYHAWAKSGGDTKHLGSFTPGVDLEASLAGDADEVLVSIEEGTPETPSSTIVVSGDADGELTFGALDAVAFSGARATAFIGDGFIDLDYEGLPELPEGYRYELWATPMGMDGAPAGDPIAAGALDTPPAGSMARFEDEELPHQLDLRVAIEAAGGRGSMSDTFCLEIVHAHARHSSGGGGGGGGGHDH
ncbi:MAG: hypothetical protein IT383_28000 [Deltaproteobacteria bacterium]|nr:hypothetical protein [Deltaproteobacteria bacterium]